MIITYEEHSISWYGKLLSYIHSDTQVNRIKKITSSIHAADTQAKRSKKSSK